MADFTLPFTEEQTHYIIIGLLVLSILILLFKKSEYFQSTLFSTSTSTSLKKGSEHFAVGGKKQGSTMAAHIRTTYGPGGSEHFSSPFINANAVDLPRNESMINPALIGSVGSVGSALPPSLGQEQAGMKSGMTQQRLPKISNFKIESDGCTLRGMLQSANPNTAGALQQMKSHIRSRNGGSILKELN
jgi:hypothetical protein